MRAASLRRIPLVRKFFASDARPQINSAGEIEQDYTSARFNLVEPLVVYAVILAAIWLFIGFDGSRPGASLSFSALVGYILFGLAGLWALLLSPLLHGDFPSTYGLPGWGKGRAFSKNMGRGARVLYWLAGIVFCALVLMNLSFTLRKLGMRDTWFYKLLLSPEHIPTTAGWIFSCTAGFALYHIVALFVIRWDNLSGALKAMLLIAIPSWGGVVLLALLQSRATGDWSLFEKFQWFGWDSRRAFIPRAAFYIFWGMIQQWVFLGYFHTRIRRGLPATPSGRLMVALLSGVFFGIIHCPSWPLVAVTFAAGAAFGYAYQFDRSKNLFVMGFVHGVGGTLIVFLTKIRMSVGPWNIEG